MLYNRGLAREYLMGHEETQNPSAAATYLLGRRRVSFALRRVAQYRARQFHRGNPLPAVAGILGSGLLGGLGGRFRAPSDKRAKKVVGAVVQAALGGNLTAARGLIERPPVVGIAKERAVWMGALAQLPQNIRAAVVKYAGSIPTADQSSPEAFAASVLASPISLADLQAREVEQRATVSAAAERRAARAEAKQATREAQIANIAGVGLQAIAGRGRRPATRRRKSRRTPRLY